MESAHVFIHLTQKWNLDCLSWCQLPGPCCVLHSTSGPATCGGGRPRTCRSLTQAWASAQEDHVCDSLPTPGFSGLGRLCSQTHAPARTLRKTSRAFIPGHTRSSWKTRVYFYISGTVSLKVSADTEQSQWCLSGGLSVGSQ